jgi:dihydrolipoamide dehydrogenase
METGNIPAAPIRGPRSRRSAYRGQGQGARHEVKVGKFPFIGNGKAIALGEAEGFVKTVFDAKTGELLGATWWARKSPSSSRAMSSRAQLETTEEDLMHTIFPHPTLSEMMHESVLDAYGRAIHY